MSFFLGKVTIPHSFFLFSFSHSFIFLFFPYLCNQKPTNMSPSNQQASVKLTGVSALLHFLVDGLCICCLYLATVGKMDIVTTYVTYNVLAFLTQPLTGWWADWMRQRHWMLLGSVLLLTLGVAACQLSTINEQFIMPTAVLLGIGNSLFHVWGGKQVAVNTGNDIRALGVFVSTGAFGLAVGGGSGGNTSIPAQTVTKTAAATRFFFHTFIKKPAHFIFRTVILSEVRPVALATAWIIARRTAALSAPWQRITAP